MILDFEQSTQLYPQCGGLFIHRRGSWSRRTSRRRQRRSAPIPLRRGCSSTTKGRRHSRYSTEEGRTKTAAAINRNPPRPNLRRSPWAIVTPQTRSNQGRHKKAKQTEKGCERDTFRVKAQRNNEMCRLLGVVWKVNFNLLRKLSLHLNNSSKSKVWK